MGATWPSSGLRDSQRATASEKETIIAAALSAAFDETIVTRQEYECRKDEPGFGNA